MGNFLRKAMEAYKEMGTQGDLIKQNPELWGKSIVDTRYNVPKEEPKASRALVEQTIRNTDIYAKARLSILKRKGIDLNSRAEMLEVQNKQVAYGIDKYPEPLNADTWSMSETVSHIMDESIDRLHYLEMLKIKLENEMVNADHSDVYDIHVANSRISMVSNMIEMAVSEMDVLLKMGFLMDAELEKGTHNDELDGVAHAVGILSQAGVNADDCDCLTSKEGYPTTVVIDDTTVYADGEKIYDVETHDMPTHCNTIADETKNPKSDKFNG
jgi:hypothetical protein